MNIKNIIREIKKTQSIEKKQIKQRILAALEEVEKLKQDFLDIDNSH